MTTCYDRDGNEDTTRVPCSTDGEYAQCCNDGELCASNGLCVRTEDDGDSSYWQNTCSDPDWMDGNVATCPTQCMDIRNAGNGVTACGSGTWCCAGFTGCDCNNSTQVFSMDPVRIVATATSVTLTSTSTSTTTSSTTTSTATDSPTSTPTDTPDSGSGGSDSNLGIGLGVGLGVGIPLVLGAIVAFWFFRRKKRRAAAGAGGAGAGFTPEGAMASPGMENYQPTPQDKRFAQLEVDNARVNVAPTELPARQASHHVAELQ